AELQRGETPVDVAVLNNKTQLFSCFFSDAHRTWVMTIEKENGYTHLDVLIQHSPQTAELILNQAMTESGADHMDKNFMLNSALFEHQKHFNVHLTGKLGLMYILYTLLSTTSRIWIPVPTNPASAHRRYLALRTMVKRRRVELLEHPVCQALIGIQMGTRQKLTNPTLILEKAIVIGILSIRLVIETVKVAFKRLQYFKNYENFFLHSSVHLHVYIRVPSGQRACQYNWICGMFSVIMAWCLLIFQFEQSLYFYELETTCTRFIFNAVYIVATSFKSIK
uniref:ANK_REP_REGION domain-containing protein n=1 Tax=Macrostomum lignano TaxID=282301 RepID=A0A1I8F2G0_9PLAT